MDPDPVKMRPDPHKGKMYQSKVFKLLSSFPYSQFKLELRVTSSDKSSPGFKNILNYSAAITIFCELTLAVKSENKKTLPCD